MLDTANALVSVDQAKEYLKITSEEEDGIVENLINRASAWANDFTKRLLLSRSLTEYYDGEGGTELLLTQYPVTTVTTVHDDPLRAFGANTLVAASDYYVDAEAGRVRLLNGVAFLTGVASIKAAYTAGYALASVPASIQEAVLLYIGHSYRREHLDQRFGVSTETVGDRTTTFKDEPFPEKAKQLLLPYRSERALLSGF